MALSLEEMRMLAEMERRMDSGEQPFVRLNGGSARWAFERELLDECGIASGQSVSGDMLRTLIEMKIANIRAKDMLHTLIEMKIANIGARARASDWPQD